MGTLQMIVLLIEFDELFTTKHLFVIFFLKGCGGWQAQMLGYYIQSQHQLFS